MPLVLISSDTQSTGQNIAEKIAETTGYTLVDRRLLQQAAQEAGVDEAQLLDALDSAPSLIGISSKTRRQSLAHVEQATLRQLLADDVVCHGLAAHLYVSGVSHALKLRVFGSEGEPAEQGAQDGGPLSGQGARALKRRNGQRKKWSLDAYALDETDAALYDVVFDLGDSTVGDVAEAVDQLRGERRVQPVHYSISALRDLELASRVRVALLADHPNARVRATSGTIVVETRLGRRDKQAKIEAVKQLVSTVEGVDYVEVHTMAAAGAP